MTDAGGPVPKRRRSAPKLGGRLWQHPDFLKFWAGQSISRLGTFVTALALPTAAIQLLGAGPVEVGALAALQSLPFPLLGIPSGVLADRLPRRPVMIVCDLGRLVALGSVPLAYLWAGLTIYHLYVVALLGRRVHPVRGGGVAGVPEGAGGARRPDGGERPAGGLQLDGWRGRPGAGRPADHWVQAPLAILVDAASYLVSATLLLAVRKPEPVLRAHRDPGRASFWRDAGRGLAATFGDRTIRLIAASSATVNLGQSIAQAVYLLYAYQSLGLNAAEVGLILTIGSVGSVLGSSIGISNAILPQSRRECIPWAAETTSIPPAGAVACQLASQPCRQQARAAGHRQDGWLVTGSRRCWGCSGGSLSSEKGTSAYGHGIGLLPEGLTIRGNSTLDCREIDEFATERAGSRSGIPPASWSICHGPGQP